MTVVKILVEGQTEEQFIVQSFAPALAPLGVFLQPTVIATKRVARGTSHKGGLSNFSKFETEMRLLLQGAGPYPISTFIDLYALPTDFPGNARPGPGSPIERAEQIEAAVWEHFGDDRLRPYVQVHEAETLVLACPDQLEIRHPGTRAHAQAAVETAGGPEFVNDGPTTAPSKRILQWASSYGKTTDGPSIVAATGLNNIRTQCAHFDGWLTWLEGLAPAP